MRYFTQQFGAKQKRAVESTASQILFLLFLFRTVVVLVHLQYSTWTLLVIPYRQLDTAIVQTVR